MLIEKKYVNCCNIVFLRQSKTLEFILLTAIGEITMHTADKTGLSFPIVVYQRVKTFCKLLSHVVHSAIDAQRKTVILVYLDHIKERKS